MGAAIALGLMQLGQGLINSRRSRGRGMSIAEAIKADQSVFGSSDQVGRVGDFFRDYLTTPTEDTEAYRTGKEQVRDAVAANTAGTRSRLGDYLSQNGMLDSGAAIDLDLAISRQEAQNLAEGFRSLYQYLDTQRVNQVLPFLQSADAAYAGDKDRAHQLRMQQQDIDSRRRLQQGQQQYDFLNTLLFGGNGTNYPGLIGDPPPAEKA